MNFKHSFLLGRILLGLSAVGFVLATAPAPLQAATAPHAGMLRYPDVSRTQIVFLYSNDLWVVPRSGGVAQPLASPPGEEIFPKFNADGSEIAFVGNYDGNGDLYTVPVSGGTPSRVTHHPAFEVLTDWTPDGRLIFYSGGYDLPYPRAQELFTVAATGGLSEKMPVPYGASGTISADGNWLAYTPHSRDQRTWKRYRGGMATDIWLFHLTEHTSRKITDWEGTDTLPMWNGSTLYYLSDGGANHRLNIWRFDVESGERQQVTEHGTYDVKWPSIGPGPNGDGEIVYQHGTELMLLDLATGTSNAVNVTVPGARPKLRPRSVDVSKFLNHGEISSTGKRAVVEARGDIWTVPAENGSPRNLTRTSGAAERSPSWSPDGRWIAYISDADGNYELFVTQSDGSGEAKKLTDAGKRYLRNLAWAPDSTKVAFWDVASKLWIYSFEDESLTEAFDSKGLANRSLSWSGDSRWLTFTAPSSILGQSRVWLHDSANDKTEAVTAGMFNDTWPAFDREGKYLFFASQREFSEPIYEDIGTTWVYAETDRLYVVPLKADTASPFAPEIDDEEWSDDEEAADDDKEDKKKKDKGDDAENDDDEDDEEVEPVEIDLEGFERRAVPLPAKRGAFGFLSVNDSGQLLYVRAPGSELIGEPMVQLIDLEDDDEPEKTVLEGANQFSISADGKKILAADDDGKMAIVDAAADQKMDKPLSMAGLVAEIDPRAEWLQIFREAWRVQRDFFYDPGMHGVDWEAVRAQYEPMIADCNSREDVSFVIREMISELNVGHSYYFGGDTESAPRVSVGLLGANFVLENGAYRITEILEGAAWDADARGPLSQPGVDVKEGDYLLAVNGVPLRVDKDPWSAFQGMAGHTVQLTVSDTPTATEDARKIAVDLIDSEYNLRYRSWIEANRRYVAEKTDGKVGYIYVPNTGISGQDDLVRQFYGQLDRAALIIDERWNGGGQIPTRFIELLNRPVANYWSLRDSDDFPWPPDAHHGPKCMLINSLAGSGGDYFPFWFKQSGLGKLIGTRTWGGLVGIGGSPPLIDNAITTAPNFAFYETDGTWGIEGHGVDPDIEVLDDPALMVDGGDPQLDAAIELMLSEIRERPYTPPTPPTYPDRSGMGITPADH